MGIRAAVIAAALALAAPAVAAERPDLTGVWTNSSLTKLTRPSGVGLVVPEAEAKAMAERALRMVDADSAPTDPRAGAPPAGAVGGYNQFWLDNGRSFARVDGQRRTSWIVEPADGQIPWSAAGLAAAREAAARPNRPPDGPESLAPADRCLIGSRGSGGPGMLNNIYNNTYQLVLTPQSLVIVVEMMHDARVVPIHPTAARAKASHGHAALHPWLGDSVGWWEGDTLVVETVNVHPEQGANGPYLLSAQARVTERFKRISAGEIGYGFEVVDPVHYSKPWRTEMVFTRSDGAVYEYACHEGNYAIHGILNGARVAEGRPAQP